MSDTAAHDHEFEVLEDDQTVPPRPEELIADASTRSDGPEVGLMPPEPGATSDATSSPDA